MLAERIYIIGSVASGKSTLARNLSQKLGIRCYELDDVVHERHALGDRKRSPEEIDTLFSHILNSDQWIIEDVLRPCFEKGLEKAEQIILLEPTTFTRKRRIVIRFIKQILHIEKSSYKPSIWMLKHMFKWCGDYDRNKIDFYKRLEPYWAKVVVLKTYDDLQGLLQTFVVPTKNNN